MRIIYYIEVSFTYKLSKERPIQSCEEWKGFNLILVNFRFLACMKYLITGTIMTKQIMRKISVRPPKPKH